MKRIAIVGGGISGLAAAYELEKARKSGADIDWQLYEASDRFGGIVETVRQDGFVLEQGPDAWVTEKPWARELAIELGLEAELIFSNDATRKTYILLDGELQPIPDRMRMMVPEDLATLEGSPLFSDSARKAYAAELTRAEELRASAPVEDESVAAFVQRHFGDEVLAKIAAPLLSGVFGGDVARLSVRAVMPAFVAMEREYGSLIAALQVKAKTSSAQPIFTSLRNGLGSLIEALLAHLPGDRLHINRSALSLKRERNLWCLRTSTPGEKGRIGKSKRHFNHVLLATPGDATRDLLASLDPAAAALIPTDASSAILAAFVFRDAAFTLPQGFGFLVPPIQNPESKTPLLAATFVTQKFPHRAPENAQILRAFFGGSSADHLADASDETIAQAALDQFQGILGSLPMPAITTVRRWPRSLPQYEVGHLERIAELDRRIASLGGLTLLGNAYRGVGLPDLIRDSRAAAKSLASK
jgi:oxygen-dependent protoporphyrinogen oxidase